MHHPRRADKRAEFHQRLIGGPCRKTGAGEERACGRLQAALAVSAARQPWMERASQHP
jgi:hypothetical protein